MKAIIIILLILLAIALIVIVFYIGRWSINETNKQLSEQQKNVIAETTIKSLNLDQDQFNAASLGTNMIIQQANRLYETQQYLLSTISINPNAKLLPVIILPGLGGSAINATWNKPKTVSWLCDKTQKSPAQIWASVQTMLPDYLGRNCWKDNFVVNYNPENQSWSNNTGVVTMIPFGSTQPCDTLLTVLGFNVWLGYYFHNVIKYLKVAGYTEGINLFGGCYDFRLFLDKTYMNNYYQQLKNLCETTLLKTGEKMCLLGHSMGCQVGQYFLSKWLPELLGDGAQEWKNQHIGKFIPIGGPFAGSPKALRTALSGDSLGLPIPDSALQSIESKLSGVLWTLPDDTLFKGAVATISGTTYTCNVNDCMAMLTKTGNPLSAQAYQQVAYPAKNPMFIPPNVATYPIYGKCVATKNTALSFGSGTECSYTYRNTDIIGEMPLRIGETAYYGYLQTLPDCPDYIKGKSYAQLNDMIGDFTVPYLSLKVPDIYWVNKNGGFPVITKEFIGDQKYEHMKIINQPDALSYLMTLITI